MHINEERGHVFLNFRDKLSHISGKGLLVSCFNCSSVVNMHTDLSESLTVVCRRLHTLHICPLLRSGLCFNYLQVLP
jgi:hypothetical protein